MRKTTIVVAMLLIVALVTPVFAATYSNPVGFVKLDLLKNKFTMVKVPMVADMRLNEDEAGTCVGEMLADALYGGSSSGNSSQINIFDAVGKGFTTVWLYDDTYPAYVGKWIEGSGVSARSLSDTQGYYIKRFADAGPDTAQAVILGDVETADTKALLILDGFNMLCFPYPVDVGVNDGDMPTLAEGAWGGTSSGASDQINTFDGVGFTTHWLFNGGVPAYDGKYIQGSGPSTYVIGAGEGFYYRRLPGQGEFTWTVERPYTLD